MSSPTVVPTSCGYEGDDFVYGTLLNRNGSAFNVLTCSLCYKLFSGCDTEILQRYVKSPNYAHFYCDECLQGANPNMRCADSFCEYCSQQLDVQMDDVPDFTPSKVAVNNVKAQNLMFVDGETAPPNTAAPIDHISYDGDMDDAAALANFLSRPVMIHTFTWSLNSTTLFPSNFLPWHLYFSDPYIKKKLDNYARIHCKLRLKFLVNATNFLYGNLRAVYTPYNYPVYNATANDQIAMSQREFVQIEPQSMTTVEMELPFFWPGNWLNAARAQDFRDMGRIDYVQYSQLRSANGVSTGSITIKCYAWAEDVSICAPTTSLAVQALDEYAEEGTVSEPASAIANVASKLKDVPIIGGYARATEIGANVVGGIAKMFGYSNPPVIEDVKGVQPKAFHAFANTELSMPLDKLALDPKNEVTIDNAVTGTSSDDPLDLTNLIQRESFLFGAAWFDSSTPDTLLASWLVVPNPSIVSVISGATIEYHTPLGYWSEYFRWWRGSMKYRIRFVKTQFHRGRLRISWDPNTNISAQPDTETTTYTRIVDLEYEDEIILEIPYKSVNPWSELTYRTGTYSNGPTPSYSFDQAFMNGCVTVRIDTALTGPATGAQIDMLIYSMAGDDFQLAVPDELPLQRTVLPVQMADVQVSDEENVISHQTIDVPVQIANITVGEVVSSIRPLLHRASLWQMQLVGNPQTGASTYLNKGVYVNTNIVSKVPRGYGYDSLGVNWTTRIVGTGNTTFNYVCTHPIDWCLNAFVGYRGSTVVHVNPHFESSETTIGTSVSIDRCYTAMIVTPTLQARNRFSVGTNPLSASTLSRLGATTQAGMTRRGNGARGMSLTNQRTQAGVSVVVPMYNNTRFYPAHGTQRDFDVQGQNNNEFIRIDSVYKLNVAGAVDTNYPTMDIYYAAGVDFNPVYYMGAPVLYAYGAPNAVDSYIP